MIEYARTRDVAQMTEDSVGSGSMYSNAAMDDAVTSLRIVLRYVLTTLLVSKEDTKDFLKQHWTSDIQTLPDADKLESGKVVPLALLASLARSPACTEL